MKPPNNSKPSARRPDNKGTDRRLKEGSVWKNSRVKYSIPRAWSAPPPLENGLSHSVSASHSSCGLMHTKAIPLLLKHQWFSCNVYFFLLHILFAGRMNDIKVLNLVLSMQHQKHLHRFFAVVSKRIHYGEFFNHSFTTYGWSIDGFNQYPLGRNTGRGFETIPSIFPPNHIHR